MHQSGRLTTYNYYRFASEKALCPANRTSHNTHNSAKNDQEPEDTSSPQQKSKRTQKCKDVQFKKGELIEEIPPGEIIFKADKVLTEMEYFERYFTTEMIELMVEQTNLYSMQKGQQINCTFQDILKFLKIELIMGFAKLPAYTDYWNTLWGYSPINTVMPVKRYQKLRGNLHFADNGKDLRNDGFYKIRAFSEMFRKICVATSNERKQSGDETMVAYKGKKQYNPKKPTKWGLKMYTRARVSGFVYDYIFFDAARTFIGREFDEDETGSLGSAGLVIIALAKTINIDEPVLCFDNYFTSFTLLKMLREKYNIYALGTIQKNRIQKTDMKFT